MSEKQGRRQLGFSPELKLRLIELIEESQHLMLDKPLKRPYDREKRWEDIGRKLNRSVADCKMAWKWLRRQYLMSLRSNSKRDRGPFLCKLKFLLPYLKEQNPLTLIPAASSSANISMINKEDVSPTPTVIEASTNSTITTDGAMSAFVLLPTIGSRQEVSTTSMASRPLSQSSSTTSTFRTKSASNAGSESTAINNSATPGTYSNDIKVTPLVLVPSYTQENESENSNTFFVTQEIIQQLLESKEKEEKQSDLVDDDECIIIDQGFIENPYNSQTTATLSSNSREINKNNISTDPVNDKSLPMHEIGEHNVLMENLTSSAETVSVEMEKQNIHPTFHSESDKNIDHNIRVKNYFLYMADQLAGLPRHVQEDICLNISEIIHQARNKHLSN